MSEANYRARQVRAKTAQVVDYHRDDARPGKPLYLLVPGGLIALISLGLIVFIAYRVWLEESLAQSTGLTLIAVLAPLYVGGVFLFSYGYELYNLPRALRLTAIIVFVTVAAVVILAVLFVLLGGLGGSSSKSSSGSKSKSSGSKSASPPAVAPRSADRSTGAGFGPVILGSGSTRTVTREVVREVPVEKKPAPPQPVTCPACGRAYIPAETQFICPSCGAPTPPDLLPPDTKPK